MDSYWPLFAFIKEFGITHQAKSLDEMFHQNFCNQMFYQLVNINDENVFSS